MDNLLNIINFLASPFPHTHLDGPGGPVVTVETFLRSVVRTCFKKLESEYPTLLESIPPLSESTPTWTFTRIILKVLAQLKTEMEHAELQQRGEEKLVQVLSLQSQMQVQSCIDLVIGFGVIPYLIPGLGMPQDVRKVNLNAKAFTQEDEQASDQEKFQRLALVMETFSEICAHPDLNVIVFSKRTCDIFAALLQLCKSPIKKPESCRNIKGQMLTVEAFNQIMVTRKKLDSFFVQVVTDLPKTHLVNTLLLLGSCPKPRWVSKTCYELMYTLILFAHEKGLIIVSQSVVQLMGRSSVWKVCGVVCNLLKDSISFDDPQGLQRDSRIENFASQILTIAKEACTTLDGRESTLSKISDQFLMVALVGGLTLQKLNTQLILDTLWLPLFNVLYTMEAAGGSITSISEVMREVLLLQKLLASSPSQSSPFPFQEFTHLWTMCFRLYSAGQKYLNQKVQDPAVSDNLGSVIPVLSDVLVTVLEIVEACTSEKGPELLGDKSGLAEFCVKLILGNEVQQKMSARYVYEFTTDGQSSEFENVLYIKTELDKENDNESLLESINTGCAHLCEVLKTDRLNKFRSSLFTELMSCAAPSIGNCAVVHSQCLLAEFDVQENVQMIKFLHMQLLADLGRNEDILSDLSTTDDPLKMIGFLQLVLKKLVLELTDSERSRDEYGFCESINFCLAIVSAFCESLQKRSCGGGGGGELKELIGNLKITWEDLAGVLPYLQAFRQSCHPALISQGIPAMAEDIMIQIETKGMGIKLSSAKKVSRYELAMKNVGSPIVPLKGHGLLELKKLLEGKDEETLKNGKTLFQVFKQEMRNSDSYVYLMAIQGLAALSQKFHMDVIPLLAREYGQLEDESELKDSNLSLTKEERVEFRMKIGETLVKVVQGLGNLAPNYKALLTNVFFYSLRDEEPLVRSSALSNLGELCHLLKFTLGAILNEVWLTIDNLLKIEKHLEVRRAALHLIVLLLRGVEKEFTSKILCQDVGVGIYLRDVRRVLSRIQDQDKDTISVIHAQLALRELELVVKKMLTPSDKLEYKLRVLDHE